MKCQHRAHSLIELIIAISIISLLTIFGTQSLQTFYIKKDIEERVWPIMKAYQDRMIYLLQNNILVQNACDNSTKPNYSYNSYTLDALVAQGHIQVYPLSSTEAVNNVSIGFGYLQTLPANAMASIQFGSYNWNVFYVIKVEVNMASAANGISLNQISGSNLQLITFIHSYYHTTLIAGVDSVPVLPEVGNFVNAHIICGVNQNYTQYAPSNCNATLPSFTIYNGASATPSNSYITCNQLFII